MIPGNNESDLSSTSMRYLYERTMNRLHNIFTSSVMMKKHMVQKIQIKLEEAVKTIILKIFFERKDEKWHVTLQIKFV